MLIALKCPDPFLKTPSLTLSGKLCQISGLSRAPSLSLATVCHTTERSPHLRSLPGTRGEKCFSLLNWTSSSKSAHPLPTSAGTKLQVTGGQMTIRREASPGQCCGSPPSSVSFPFLLLTPFPRPCSSSALSPRSVLLYLISLLAPPCSTQ